MKKNELLSNIHVGPTTSYGTYNLYYENNKGCWKYRWTDSTIFDELTDAHYDDKSITIKRLLYIRHEIIENGKFYHSYNEAYRSSR